MAELTTLREAIAELVRDGDTVAVEGFTHLISFAGGHEIVRQGKRELTLVRMTPDVVYDQMIGMGCASRLVFSWAGNPGVGSLHRIREAIERGWPHPLEIEEYSHAGMANRYAAGASGLPFAVMRGYRGTDLRAHSSTIAFVTCPFTGEDLSAVPALNPDVAIVHAQQADRHGNVRLWGLTGIHKEVVLASRRSIVTVEEIVADFATAPAGLSPSTPQLILPSRVVTAVARVPGGAHPSYAMGYSRRDNDFYRAWDPISRDRTAFRSWMERHLAETEDLAMTPPTSVRQEV